MKLPFSEWRRTRKLMGEPFPDAWRAILAAHVPHWRYLDGEERLVLEEYTLLLVADKRWEASRGFTLTDEIRVTIAGQAALLILAIGFDAYRNVGSIIVHPTTMKLKGQRAGPARGTVVDAPIPVLGVAHYQGPVIVAWDSVLAGARHPEHGHNVVYHEFAHKLDMLDDVIDGTPPIAVQEQMQRWVDVCTAEYEALRAGNGDFLRTYAAVNPAEFFAVATEAFFDIPVEMETAKPDLYGVLRDFYRQDPAQRVRSFTNSPPERGPVSK
ncbi:MAG: zinc-dependent peptidase [Actinomycetota bacterium]|nr:zinc-dependent peptidase [Actinomycetota bacterium]